MQVYTFCSICGGGVDPPTPHLFRLHQEPLLLLPDNCQGGQQDPFISVCIFIVQVRPVWVRTGYIAYIMVSVIWQTARHQDVPASPHLADI